VNKSNKLCQAGAAVFAFCCATSSALADQSSVVGPIDSVDPHGTFVVVLGQRFALPVADSAANLSMRISVDRFPIGSLVIAEGERLGAGTFQLDSLKKLQAPYVPGASQVYIRGAIDSVDSSLGIVRIGELQIQVTPAMSTGNLSFAAGDSIELVGTQALVRGSVWATHIQIAGSNIQGIEGTGKAVAQGIEGTGKAASLLGIEGTGKTVSIQGIEGTGKVSAQGIEGTGKAASQGIEGTGRAASLQGIEGTGKAVAQGIEGTGKAASLLGIEGTGKAVSIQGIEGTGKAAAQGIEGTGRAASLQGIEGTGKAASIQGIEGTGKVSAQGIEGTGK